MKNYLKAIGLSALMTASLMAETLVRPVTIDYNGVKYLGKVEYTEGKDKSTMRISEGNSAATFVDDKNDGTVDYFSLKSVSDDVTLKIDTYRKDMDGLEELFDSVYNKFKIGIEKNLPLSIKINNQPLQESQPETKTLEL